MRVRPVKILGREEVMSIEKDLIEQLLRLATTRTNIPRERWVHRDILPHIDLGLATEVWSFDYTTGLAENHVVSHQLPANRFLGFCKVAYVDPDPVAIYVKFATGRDAKMVKDVWHIQDIWLLEEPEAYTPEPILYGQQEWVHMFIYPERAKTGDKLVFGGFTVELLGETITVAVRY